MERMETKAVKSPAKSLSLASELFWGSVLISAAYMPFLLLSLVEGDRRDALSIAITTAYSAGLFVMAVVMSRLTARAFRLNHTPFLSWPAWLLLVLATRGVFSQWAANALVGDRGHHHVAEEAILLAQALILFGGVIASIALLLLLAWKFWD